MALTGSGAISLSDIAGEFGVSAPYSLTDFYRGGANVPDIPANSGVPTSGAISITDFYGAENFTVTVSGQTISSTTDALVKFDADGKVYEFETDPGSYVQIDTSTDWVRPVAAASGTFEVKFTLSSGDTPTGTLGTWLSLDTDRAIGFSSELSAKSADVLAEIRYDGGSVIDSATYTLTVSGT